VCDERRDRDSGTFQAARCHCSVFPKIIVLLEPVPYFQYSNIFLLVNRYDRPFILFLQNIGKKRLQSPD
jgi:hypothetical protein